MKFLKSFLVLIHFALIPLTQSAHNYLTFGAIPNDYSLNSELQNSLSLKSALLHANSSSDRTVHIP